MMEKNELLHILRKYQVDSSMLNDALVEKMLEHIKNGMPAEQAVSKVLSGDVYFPALLPLMMSSIVSAACLGYGVKNPSKSQQAALEDVLKNEPWASDELSFNDRLPAMKKNMRQTIKSSIDSIKSKIKRMEQSVKEMLGFLRIPKKAQQEIWGAGKPDISKSIEKIAKEVKPNISDKPKMLEHEIIDEKLKEPGKVKKEKDPPTSSQLEQPIEIKKLPEVKKPEKEKPKYIEPLPAPKDLAHELPGYLRRLELAARGLSGGNPQFLATYQAALKAAQKEIEKFIERSKRGTQNQILKGDYDLLIRSAQELAKKSNQYAWDSLNRQVEYAIKRRAAYFAERITRSEDARAWFDGFIAQYQDDENVIAYKWKLSSRHHLLPYDQCDVCANMDVGLGKGIYPKNKLPSIPRHPHCMCTLVQVYVDEVDKETVFSPDKARKYIDSLKEDDRITLFGKAGLEKYQQGGNWESLMRGWDGFREPKSRLQGVFSATDKFSVGEPSIPKFIKNVTAENALQELKNAEKEIVKQDFETAILITTKGAMYRIDGTEGFVNLNGLDENKLYGAMMTHNHPAKVTYGSLSSFDISEAMRNRFSLLRAVDKNYICEIKFNNDTIFEKADIINHKFTDTLRKQLLEDILFGKSKLVLHPRSIQIKLGYNRFNLILASWVLNCQFIFTHLAFRFIVQILTSRLKLSISGHGLASA